MLINIIKFLLDTANPDRRNLSFQIKNRNVKWFNCELWL